VKPPIAGFDNAVFMSHLRIALVNYTLQSTSIQQILHYIHQSIGATFTQFCAVEVTPTHPPSGHTEDS
jgi:hypothetical protein